jgi:hypothetical protein
LDPPPSSGSVGKSAVMALRLNGRFIFPASLTQR